jgi:hypothetical protein
MQTGWRLEQTYLAGVGFPESRMEGLTIDWSEPFEPTGHAALWADNGTGKTTITALRFALYQPHPRDFIRGGSDRSFAKLVSSGDVCHVVEQATRLVDGGLQRVVTGMVAHWADGGSQDLDNPSRLERIFYGWVTDEHGPAIADLPVRTPAGRWTTNTQFVGSLRELLPSEGVLPPYEPSDHQGRWRQWLTAAGIDLEQVRFQAMMNASEGGVDKVMRFTDSDDFVRWLVGAITPAATVEQIARGIEALRDNAAARPRWADELAFWERLVDPLLRMAIQHEEVEGRRRAVATAEADGAAVVADADATTAELTAQQERARQRHADHDQQRRDAAAKLRRAQAHRLRMQLRAAELHAKAAAETADAHEHASDEAARRLAAWRLVADVLQGRECQARLAGLNELLAVAEQETGDLQRIEARYRRDLARLLTHRRDQAAEELTQAKRALEAESRAVENLDKELQKTIATHATATERQGQASTQIAASEQTIEEAVAGGLLPEGTDPAGFDRSLADRMERVREDRDTAGRELKKVEQQISTERGAIETARGRAKSALGDVRDAERRSRELTGRIDAIVRAERFLNVVGTPAVEVWAARPQLTESFAERAEQADDEVAEARRAITAARRTVDSVGADGLLPPSLLVERIVRDCQEEEIPAWSGWRWLADTMAAAAAESFARARPDIVSGVVVAHPDWVDRAAEHAVSSLEEARADVAIWIGAVVDEQAAFTAAPAVDDDAVGGTHARILLPPAGAFDRDAAAVMVEEASSELTAAAEQLKAASQRGTDARNMLAALRQLWTDYPDDPRTELDQAIERARSRVQEAENDLAEATLRLDALNRRHSGLVERSEDAQHTLDATGDARRLLQPVIAAATSLADARARLPELRRTLSDTQTQMHRLEQEKQDALKRTASLSAVTQTLQRNIDDAAEAIRVAKLTPLAEGPLPADEERTIRARLRSVEEALADAAVDPSVREEVERTRGNLADLEAMLDIDPDLRSLAEQFADSDGARHPVALRQSINAAERDEAEVRAVHAKARSDADAAAREFRRRADDASDRSSPDMEGHPAADQVESPDDALLHAAELDDLAAHLLMTQRIQEERAEGAKAIVQRAGEAMKLVKAAVEAVRHLADDYLIGRPTEDINGLVERSSDVTRRLRETAHALAHSERELRSSVSQIRAWVNGPHARRVEDKADTHLADLIHRLRSDDRMAAEAEGIAEQLEQRVLSLRDDLERHDQDVRTCAMMLHVQAATAVQRLRAYQNQSRLPEGLGDWSHQRFVVIDHERIPDDDSVAVDRVSRVVHDRLTPGAGKTSAQELLFAATRALVDAPFRVRILKPHTDLSLDRVDVTELKNFSGGQRVTAGVLLYATMTRVRAAGDATSTGWLWLDNPFGQASADQFVRTMRRAADQLGLQLLFTAAPKDMGALSMFDRTITLARRSRPSSGEKLVIVDDRSRELVDLTLIQRDVNAVLGE